MTDETSGNWYSAETSTFGDRLAGAREAAGISQTDLARRLGVKLKTVTSWEQDLLEPRANRLQMLAGLLNVSIMWLLTGEGDGIPGPDEGAAIAPDVTALLGELRQLKSEMGRSAERLGLLEKRLRLALSEAS